MSSIYKAIIQVVNEGKFGTYTIGLTPKEKIKQALLASDEFRDGQYHYKYYADKGIENDVFPAVEKIASQNLKKALEKDFSHNSNFVINHFEPDELIELLNLCYKLWDKNSDKEYVNIIHLQDYKDEEGYVEKFLNGDIDSDEIVAYLSQWDFGSESEIPDNVSDKPHHGSGDRAQKIEHEGDTYILSYNTGLGYVALDRVKDKEEDENSLGNLALDVRRGVLEGLGIEEV
jgi:hypothetical protein